MNFIGEWCRNKCTIGGECESCSEICLPRFNIANTVGISEHLVCILMNECGGVTHPDIANDIADYLGATAEERDSIVARPHRGTWTPGANKHTKTTRPYCLRGKTNSRVVVAIDGAGNEISRFPSAVSAAIKMQCSDSYIGVRCNRTFTCPDEFGKFAFTFRFAEEWDAMTPEERAKDLRNPKARCND